MEVRHRHRAAAVRGLAARRPWCIRHRTESTTRRRTECEHCLFSSVEVVDNDVDVHLLGDVRTGPLAKRGNSLRVEAEAVRWGKRGRRINTISPGIVMTPLARDELTGPRGEGYRRMIDLCPVAPAPPTRSAPS